MNALAAVAESIGIVTFGVKAYSDFGGANRKIKEPEISVPAFSECINIPNGPVEKNAFAQRYNVIELKNSKFFSILHNHCVHSRPEVGFASFFVSYLRQGGTL